MRLWKLLSVFFTLTFLTLCSDGKIDNGSSQNKNDKIKTPELPEDIKNFLQGPPALARAKNCENVVAYLSTLIGTQIERMKNVDVNKIKRGGVGGTYAQTEAISSGLDTNYRNYFIGTQPSEPKFSETNVLERGIDEGDIVKTDGKYIYLVDQGLVRVVSAYPPEQITTVAQISTQGA